MHISVSERLALYNKLLNVELNVYFYRAKKLMWPSIPNPENSNAVQKIEIAYELVSKKQYNGEIIIFDILLYWKRIYENY